MVPKKTILIVEDDKEILRMMTGYLRSSGYDVLGAEDGATGLNLFQSHKEVIKVVLLDVMLPVKNGLEVLEGIREESDVPVIMVTALDQDYDQVLGLRKGADDYIAKPFSPSVLLARIEAVARRQLSQSDNFRIGELRFQEDPEEVYYKEELLDLTVEEYRILYYFARHPDELLTASKVCTALQEKGFALDDRAIEKHLATLREKTVDSLIRRVYGAGFIFRTGETR